MTRSISNTSGSLKDRCQQALDNFYYIFRDLPSLTCPANSCAYEWIQARDWNLYLVFADSCFVGDPHWEHTRPAGVPYFDTTAKGKLACEQVEKLLRWNDEGRRGNLQIRTSGAKVAVPSEQYVASLKILIMHHYLFEPHHHRHDPLKDPLLRFVDECRVFRNIALADFDALWCGHKHKTDFTQHTYGYHMGKEGRSRYLFNCLRRNAGMASLPLPMLPISRKMPSQYLRFVLGLIAGMKSRRPIAEESDDRVFGDEVKLISLAIEEPRAFERAMKQVIGEMHSAAVAFPDAQECMTVARRFEEEFDHDERKRISANMNVIGRRLVANFRNRPFIQALAASSSKRQHHHDSDRGFFVHELRFDGEKYTMTMKPYEWRNSIAEFVPGETQSHAIPISRNP